VPHSYSSMSVKTKRPFESVISEVKPVDDSQQKSVEISAAGYRGKPSFSFLHPINQDSQRKTFEPLTRIRVKLPSKHEQEIMQVNCESENSLSTNQTHSRLSANSHLDHNRGGQDTNSLRT
jgi:hypothetical protein